MSSYYLGMFGDGMPATFAAAKDKLMPVVRDRALQEYIRLSQEQAAGETSTGLACVPFSADALLMIVCDCEHSMSTLNQQNLSDWGVTFDEALAVASNNLRDATVSNFAQFIPGLFVSDWNDYYDSSRILFSDVVFQRNVGAEPVMMIPTRNRLFVTSANDTAGLLAMISLSEKVVADEGRAVSALMYRFANGQPVPYTPTDDAVRDRLAHFRRTFLADDYASQKDLMDRANEKNGVDLFVGTYQLVQDKQSGRSASMGVWTEDVDTLLPEVDLVVLVSKAELDDGEVDTKFVNWADLQAVTGQFERLDEGYPARYKPVNFPDKARREALDEARI